MPAGFPLVLTPDKSLKVLKFHSFKYKALKVLKKCLIFTTEFLLYYYQSTNNNSSVSAGY